MFVGVGAVVDDDAGELPGGEPSLPVDRDCTEGGDEALGCRYGHAAHRHAVGRAEDQHPTDDVAALHEFGIGTRGNGAGVDVARVGHDQRFGCRHHFGRQRAGQVAGDLGVETMRIGRVEQTGYGRLTLGRVSHDFLFP